MIESLLSLAQSDAGTLMAEKLSSLWPEITLFVTTCAAMVLGLSPQRAVRDAVPMVCVLGLAVSAVLALTGPTLAGSPLAGLMPYTKTLVALLGIPLILLMTGTVDREFERALSRGMPFDGIRSTRGEFYAFAMFSLTGLMLCASADDLIWLFLALELTSLPTYVMVSISTGRARSQEAGIKYFFLGAFGAAIFLFGFALIYGATGTTLLFGGEYSVASAFASGGLGAIGLLGIVLAIIGICFKIAAVPMHYYTPDVYEGAATSVSAFLAFVPKAAGFLALMLLLSAVGWTHGGEGAALPEAVRITLWVIAALTMTVGNILALLQKNIKRVLAYSSIAHSGYMLVGIIAGPGEAASLGTNGLGAVLFYLLCYGVMNLGAFAVLACLERSGGDEIETFDDVRGLCAVRPMMGWVLVLCSASLLGLPPLLGFWGKLYLFTAGISAGEYALVALLGINSAVAAFYYLKLVALPLLESPDERASTLRETPYIGRVVAATLSAASVVALLPFVSALTSAADSAARPEADREVDVSQEATRQEEQEASSDDEA